MSGAIVDAIEQHYARLWGAPNEARWFSFGDHRIAIQKWAAQTDPHRVNMYATVGACMLPQWGYPSTHRFEFFIGLFPAKDEVASVLANVAFFSVRKHVQIGPGHTITWIDEPLWPGTKMQSVLVDRPTGDIVPALQLGSEDDLHVEFLDVTLLYPSEVEFKKQHSLDALIEHWYRHNVNYTDPDRPPEPE